MAEVATQNWRLERYRAGDEVAMLELFRTVFGKARSLEHWNWQFRDNPYGGPFVSVARRESDGLLVGSYSVMPVMLNMMGRPVLACQSVDTAVHPDFRGQRIFEKTASDCYAWCESEGVKAVVGFPNASSYPGFVRSLAWKRIVFPVQHLLRLGIGSSLKKVLPLPLLPGLVDAGYRAIRATRLSARRSLLRRVTGSDVVFHVGDRVPEAYESLWNAWRSQEVLSIWKDRAYFEWRYDRNPDYRFRYYYLARGEEILALAVGVEIDGGLSLCELLVRTRDVLLGSRFVSEICLHALDAGFKTVSLLAYDAGYFEDVTRGFTHQKSYTNVFGGRSFDGGSLTELLPHPGNWTITFGDGDFV